MSPQFNFPNERKPTIDELAQVAVGTQLPRVKRPYPRRFSLTHGGRKQRFHTRYWTQWAHRPIQTYLVTHRRRFTTGHKHKQPYQG